MKMEETLLGVQLERNQLASQVEALHRKVEEWKGYAIHEGKCERIERDIMADFVLAINVVCRDKMPEIYAEMARVKSRRYMTGRDHPEDVNLAASKPPRGFGPTLEKSP